MGFYLCPICQNPLACEGNSQKCEKGHSFDIAKQGYVNLLTGLKQGQIPGDNKEMVEARRFFLSAGHYAFMKEELCNMLVHVFAEKKLKTITFLDCGCGEGYYTSSLRKALSSLADVNAYGIDISKKAAAIAAKQDREIKYAVASAFHLPVKEESCDLVCNLFAPYAGEQYLRVLKQNGIFAMVIPGRRHLFELKSVIYDEPYENEVKDFALPGFNLIAHRQIEKMLNLSSTEEIESLFQMTPYYYKTPPEYKKRLDELKELTTLAQFEILIYQKN